MSPRTRYAMPTRLPVRFCALTLSLLCSISLVYGADDPADALAPALKGEPSADGLITWWLNSPLLKEPFDKIAAPKNVREGDAIPGSDGKWSLYIAPARSVTFREYALSKGVVLSCVHIFSPNAGGRRLSVASCGGVKVFLNGQLCIDKPEPFTPVTDLGEATIDLAQGMNEICVATNMRQGYITNFQFAIRQTGPPGVKPAAGDLLVLPTEKGKEAQPEAVLVRSLTFNAKESFVKPGDKIALAAYILGSVPWNLGLLTPTIVDPDGNPVPSDVPRTASELGTRSFWQSQYTVPSTKAPSITLTLQIKSGEKTLGTKTLSLFNYPGLQATAEALTQSLKERAQRAGHPFPNAALYAEKAGQFLNKIETHDELPSPQLGDAIVQYLEIAKRCATAEEAGNDPWEGKTGYFEKAYQSEIDESAQPYQLQVPRSFAAPKDGKKYPLVLFLHGYVPYYDRQHWWDEAPDFDVIFEKNDCFLALPFGRSNTDFQSCGETDVLDVLADVRKHYPIDENRIYLYGYSMGGMGVYTIGAHHPDLFAAGIVLAGRADSPLQNFKPLNTFAPYKQWIIQSDNPISLCENFVNIPLRLYHGRDDTIINVSESNRMEARLKEVGCDVKLQLGPGSHGYGLEIMFSAEPVAWLLSHTRGATPEKNHLKTFRLEYAKQNNVAVTATTGELQPIELEWTTKDGAVAFTKDDAKVLQRSIAGKLEPAKLDGLRKSPQLCGPVREAVCSAFMVVYGTKGTPQAVLANRRNADQFAADWKEFSKSPALIKADTEVTAADKAAKNLFLFGEEQENTIHAECAAKLPFSVKNGNAVIDGKTVPLEGKGLMYLYPSPLANPEHPRSVIICAGMLYGAGVSSNHKLDLVPDFILFDDKRDNDGTSTNRALCAGFFNGEWKLDPKMIWWSDK